MGFRISVDTGGTFTDIVVMDDAGQQTTCWPRPTC
jgi:N-methylhydantoinase A/oxoprolinase/acetone carboxylase beta subunit